MWIHNWFYIHFQNILAESMLDRLSKCNRWKRSCQLTMVKICCPFASKNARARVPLSARAEIIYQRCHLPHQPLFNIDFCVRQNQTEAVFGRVVQIQSYQRLRRKACQKISWKVMKSNLWLKDDIGKHWSCGFCWKTEKTVSYLGKTNRKLYIWVFMLKYFELTCWLIKVIKKRIC